jgi:DNA-binding IclR family transcriptional regulator
MVTPHQESVLSRAARILEAFSQDRPALTVSEIARRAGLPLPTASRLVAELTAHGFLSRDETRRVRIGVRLWELVTRASPALSLRDAAMPFMEGVHDVVGHHVQLGVLDGCEVLFLERLSSHDAVINYTRIAGRLPLHVSSSGLILLAHGSAELRERVLCGPLASFGPHTPTDPAAVRRLLAEVRLQGYAFCPGFLHGDALGIAAPVRGHGGEVVAALAVIVPNDSAAQQMIPAVRAAARGVSRRLGAAEGTESAAP